jgi:Dual specificity phosphatase, catalytic domain
MGISRSATAVIAYLIATTTMTLHEALAAVRAKRAIVRPNRGFMSQLQEYYSKYPNSLQAALAKEPPDKDCNGKREKQKAPRSYSMWDARDAARVYWHNALATAMFFPPTVRHQHVAEQDYWKFESESHIS